MVPVVVACTEKQVDDDTRSRIATEATKLNDPNYGASSRQFMGIRILSPA